MNWLPSLAAWPFAAAGVAGAVAALLIHLLSRRRYPVVPWGAMEFLREAFQRQRRVLQVRDGMLLLLRCLAVLLFGVALARPQFAGSAGVDPLRPVHAVLVIDNSLSMSYETLDGTLLQRARQAARELIDRLPPGSQASILPACRADKEAVVKPLTSRTELLAAVERVSPAAGSASLPQMIADVTAAGRSDEQLARRIVVLSDLQAATWRDPQAVESGSLEGWQVVDLAPRLRDNTWIEDLQVRHGFAIQDESATIRVTIRRTLGVEPRDCQVTLAVNGQPVASKVVVLEEGNTSQTVTFDHVLKAADEPLPNGTVAGALLPAPPTASVTVSLTPDRLKLDDMAELAVPVFPRLPIVFVDQYRPAEEDARLGRLGETRALRRLFQSASAQVTATRGIKHVKYSELTETDLAGARLVVVAGVRDPAGIVSVLRRFVEHGGRLIIAAGGDFDPLAWNQRAWLRGEGILPASLPGGFVGATPAESDAPLRPLLLDADMLLQQPYFRLPENPEEVLRNLFAEPLVFKAVIANPTAPELTGPSPQVLARSQGPSALPLILERQIGRGKVLLVATGLTSNWNTLSKTNALVLLDHLARTLIRETLAESDQASGFSAEAAISKIAGDVAESDLTRAEDAAIAAFKAAAVTFPPSSAEIRWTDSSAMEPQLWWWLVLAVLLLQLAELSVLAFPSTQAAPEHAMRWQSSARWPGV